MRRPASRRAIIGRGVRYGAIWGAVLGTLPTVLFILAFVDVGDPGVALFAAVSAAAASGPALGALNGLACASVFAISPSWMQDNLDDAHFLAVGVTYAAWVTPITVWMYVDGGLSPGAFTLLVSITAVPACAAALLTPRVVTGEGRLATEDGRRNGGVRDNGRVNTTKRKLLDATVETLRDHGIAGTSARAIATAAGVNQALVFYHFGTVAELVDAASRDATEARVALYRARFALVQTLGELLELGRSLHEAEREAGNVQMMAQVMAGAQQDEPMALAAQHTLGLWIEEIESTLRRVLAGSPLAEVADPAGLARAVSASFIGIELYDGVDRAGAEQAWAALEQLTVLVDVLEDLGPVARRALRSRVRKAGAR